MCATTSSLLMSIFLAIPHNLSVMPLGFPLPHRIAKEWLARRRSLLWWALSSSPYMNPLLHCASTWHPIRIIWVSHGPKSIVGSILFLMSVSLNLCLRRKGNYRLQSCPSWSCTRKWPWYLPFSEIRCLVVSAQSDRFVSFQWTPRPGSPGSSVWSFPGTY